MRRHYSKEVEEAKNEKIAILNSQNAKYRARP